MSSLKFFPSGVLFDFDGVIVDSKTVHHNAWQQAHQMLFDRDLPYSYPNEHNSGITSMQTASFLAAAVGKEQQNEELAILKLHILLNDSPFPDLLPGARALIGFLDRHGIPFGIASNAPTAFINHSMAGYGLEVANIIGADQITNPKPAPDAYLLCAEVAGVSPDRYGAVYVFEDSVAGVSAGVAAGMITVGVETTLSRDELLNAGAVYSCRNLREAFDGGWFASNSVSIE
ncbi:MAG: HAD family hydrolase [Spirochaeta sp.]